LTACTAWQARTRGNRHALAPADQRGRQQVARAPEEPR
jgi:hypothetical protein